MTKQQQITDNYAIYNSDCMEVMPTLPDESIDLSVYSPPFSSLYTYSSDARDMSNVDNDEQFLKQYEYLVKEMARVTKKGRINAVHCTDLHKSNNSLIDFPSHIIKLHQDNGFLYMGKITIFKEPLKVRIKTMMKSLMHKFIVEDTTRNFPAMPDYVILFKRKGENEIPVTHPFGLMNYAGESPVMPETVGIYNRANGTDYQNPADLWRFIEKKYEGHKDPKTNKMSQMIWQRYASSIWDDIRLENCLPYKNSKEDDDEKHVTPTQLDVIDRLVELYSNPGETLFTPFMGVGTEVYSAVSMGRKALGVELKDSYYKQACLNVEDAFTRFKANETQATLF